MQTKVQQPGGHDPATIKKKQRQPKDNQFSHPEQQRVQMQFVSMTFSHTHVECVLYIILFKTIKP